MRHDDEPDLSGQQLDRYRLLRQLGVGGMGAVYEAEHTELRKRIAVKVLRRADAAEEVSRQRFLREARAASLIEHPNVVAITDCGRTSDGQVFLAMELLKGRDLGQVLNEEQKLPWSRAKGILLQVAAALDAAHRHEVLHRDVKPSNCFLVEGMSEERDVVKVLDFGVAKLMGSMGEAAASLTSTGDFVGSVAYVAPERVLHENVDYRSDIYSVGVMMYRMLTGGLPFKDGDALSILRQHMSSPVPGLRDREPSIPRGVEAIVRRAMAKNPDDRFQSMLAFADAVRTDGAGLEEEEDLRAPPNAPAVEATVSLAAPSLAGLQSAEASYEATTAFPNDITISTASPRSNTPARVDDALFPEKVREADAPIPLALPKTAPHFASSHRSTQPSPSADSVPTPGPAPWADVHRRQATKPRVAVLLLAVAGALSIAAALAVSYGFGSRGVDEAPEPQRISAGGRVAPTPSGSSDELAATTVAAEDSEPENDTTTGPNDLPHAGATPFLGTTGEGDTASSTTTLDETGLPHAGGELAKPASAAKAKPREGRRKTDEDVIRSMKRRIFSKCKESEVQRIRVEGSIDRSGRVSRTVVTPPSGPGVCVKEIVAGTRFPAGEPRFIPMFTLML